MNIQSEKDMMDFIEKLKLLKINMNYVSYEMLPLCGIGTTIAYSRFLILYKKICFASHALINAYNKNHKDFLGNNIENPLWERSMYFENAVITYNSILDYIYAILYFNFDLYINIGNATIINKEDIIEISKNIKYKIKEIDIWLINETSKKEFLSELNDYKNLVKDLREMANDIKHRGCLIIEGMHLPRNTNITMNINDFDINITEIVTPSTINIDDEISKLVKIHEKAFDVLKALYYLCDFEGQLKNKLNANNINLDYK